MGTVSRDTRNNFKSFARSTGLHVQGPPEGITWPYIGSIWCPCFNKYFNLNKAFLITKRIVTNPLFTVSQFTIADCIVPLNFLPLFIWKIHVSSSSTKGALFNPWLVLSRYIHTMFRLVVRIARSALIGRELSHASRALRRGASIKVFKVLIIWKDVVLGGSTKLVGHDTWGIEHAVPSVPYP